MSLPKKNNNSNTIFVPSLNFQELFKRVIPHQCLGAVWSRRDKSRDRDAASVVATVEQFNAVSYRVISTVLMTVEAKPQHRAKVIVKWIDIAQVCSTFLVLNIFMILLLGMYIPTLPILDFFELFETRLKVFNPYPHDFNIFLTNL